MSLKHGLFEEDPLTLPDSENSLTDPVVRFVPPSTLEELDEFEERMIPPKIGLGISESISKEIKSYTTRIYDFFKKYL